MSLTDQNLNDLSQVNWLAKADWRRKKLCYAVKDVIISQFGKHRGLVCQQFERKCWDDQDYYWGDIFSIHKHILEVVEIGNKIFHKPTNEFSYEDARGHKKRSEDFDAVYKFCTPDPVMGIMEPPADFDKKAATLALRRLVHDHYALLRSRIEKPKRTLYPFIQPYSQFPGSSCFRYTFRIPESIATCSGCGRKLSVTLDESDLDPARTEFGLFGPNPTRIFGICCDAERGVRDYICPENRARQRSDWTGWENAPYQKERAPIAAWLIGVIPEYNEWRRFKEMANGQ